MGNGQWVLSAHQLKRWGVIGSGVAGVVAMGTLAQKVGSSWKWGTRCCKDEHLV